jgi:DNA-binding beta-propeller fold protein YncE
MEQRRSLVFGGATAAALLVGLTAGCEAQLPVLEVDPFWPQPLEYPYILGPISGITVAPDGNILIVTRQDGFNTGNEINSVQGTGDCCTPTQAVLEYAPDGSLVRQWGGPDQGYLWPQTPHGIAVDPEGNVWIGGGVRAAGGGGRGGGAPAGPMIDTQVLKFSRTGEHLGAFDGFTGAGRFAFEGNEAFVADGYGGHRVVVLDVATGEVLREWGAYGNAPSTEDLGAYDPAAPPAQQFRSVTCAAVSNDGMVYVCDRGNDRIQVFETDGTYVTEAMIAPSTLGSGSVWDIAFSADGGQDFLYVADGMNERVWVLTRSNLQPVTSFGIGGRVPGTFRELGSVAVDAAGNVYTAENGQGRRVQKFTMTGTTTVPTTLEHQGAIWPASALGGDMAEPAAETTAETTN